MVTLISKNANWHMRQNPLTLLLSGKVFPCNVIIATSGAVTAREKLYSNGLFLEIFELQTLLI